MSRLQQITDGQATTQEPEVQANILPLYRPTVLCASETCVLVREFLSGQTRVECPDDGTCSGALADFEVRAICERPELMEGWELNHELEAGE